MQFSTFFSFHIHYQADFGQTVVVVGDHPEFGAWDASKGIVLDWNEGHFWTRTKEISWEKDDGISSIEYKYVVCERKNSELIPVKWENGENRHINFCSPKTRHVDLTMNDVWGYKKIKLYLRNTFSDSQKLVYLLLFIGNQSFLKQMTKSDEKKTKSFWKLRFFVELSQTHLKYYYFCHTKGKNEIFWDRLLMRQVSLKSEKRTRPFVIKKHNSFKIYDKDFYDSFNFNEINENLFVGPFPQNEKEVELLNQKGVKSVMNLQQKEDVYGRDFNLKEMKKIYQKFGICLKKFQIRDNFPDLTAKILPAAFFLNDLIQEYGKVYIHCTAGMIRAPSVVVAYLLVFQNYSLEEAVKLIQEKRPIAKPNINSLMRALVTE